MACAVTVLGLASASLYASSQASAQPRESAERARELEGPESSPDEPTPVLPTRPSDSPDGAPAFAGDLTVEDGPDDESEREAAVPAVGAGFSPTYYYLTGNGHVPLPSRNSHVCALHRLRGVMETNAVVRARYFDDNTQELGALDGNPSFSSSAACVPKSKFFNDSPSPISTIFPTKFWFAQDGQVLYQEEWGNAAAILSGIGGPFRELVDRAWVWQEPNETPNVVDITSDGEGYITGYSTAFWFNETAEAQQGIKFIGPGGTGGASQAGEYYVLQSGAGATSVQMANADTAFCYLTGVNGELANGSDEVRIYLQSSTHRYVLKVNKASSAGLHAYARCMAFDQR